MGNVEVERRVLEDVFGLGLRRRAGPGATDGETLIKSPILIYSAVFYDDGFMGKWKKGNNFLRIETEGNPTTEQRLNLRPQPD